VVREIPFSVPLLTDWEELKEKSTVYPANSCLTLVFGSVSLI